MTKFTHFIVQDHIQHRTLDKNCSNKHAKCNFTNTWKHKTFWTKLNKKGHNFIRLLLMFVLQDRSSLADALLINL